MLNIKRTNSEDTDFQKLVLELDKDLAVRNGDSNDFFVQYNKIDSLNHVVVAYVDQVPVGCGAIKEYEVHSMEVKRMYVLPENRGTGVSVAVLKELEDWAMALGYKKCVLETGLKMPEAIGLYAKSGYQKIPNYGQYAGVEESVCFEKQLA